MERMSQASTTSIGGNYWCHTCKAQVQVTLHEDNEIACNYPSQI